MSTEKQKEEYRILTEVFDVDLDKMTPAMKYAWFGLLFGYYDSQRLALDDYKELRDRLGFKESEASDIYDALAGGITERP